MNPIVVIPARLNSARLQRKVLADIHGKPMLQHVWERAVAAAIGPVVVAAADAEICAVMEAVGARCVLTDPDLPKGSDRVWAGLQEIDPAGAHDIVVNLQGDQPTTEPALLQTVLAPLHDPAVSVATLAVPFEKNAGDGNIVKVVLAERVDRRGRCVYFSRAPVPHGGPFYYHLGIYAYRRSALAAYARSDRTPLELSEGLEQLRLLEGGYRYDAMIVDSAPLSVDTKDDLDEARRVIASA